MSIMNCHVQMLYNIMFTMFIIYIIYIIWGAKEVKWKVSKVPLAGMITFTVFTCLKKKQFNYY